MCRCDQGKARVHHCLDLFLFNNGLNPRWRLKEKMGKVEEEEDKEEEEKKVEEERGEVEETEVEEEE